MASNEVLIRGAPVASKAKIRNPVWVVVWSVLSLGVYAWFWWYFINREMRDLGQARGTTELGDNPTLSALAVSLGSLISSRRSCRSTAPASASRRPSG